jgi:PhnB protein
MSVTERPVPSGYERLTPYLVVRRAAAAIDWYARVLGARERMRLPGPGGTVAHAELLVGEALLMLSDEAPDMGFVGPETVGGSGVVLHAYVDDADEVHARALAEGATQIRPVEKQFYGDRSGSFRDPFGHLWSVATRVEDVPPEEMARRMAALGGA